MICPNCGRETPDGMAFCFNCGARLAAPSQAQQQAQQAAEQVQREAQEAQTRAEQEAQEAAARAQREAEEAAARAQYEAQQAQQQAAQQAQQAQQQFNPQYAQQPYGQQQYAQQPYGQQQYAQQPYAQQYQAPPQPKQPSKFDKLLTGEPPLVLDFYTKHYNTLLAVGSMISIAFTGVVFALLMGATGWMFTTLFFAAATLGAAIFAQILLSNKKTLGWIMTLVAGGLRWFTLLFTMIALFAKASRIPAAVLYNIFYFIVALMIQGALLAFCVIVFIKNKDKWK